MSKKKTATPKVKEPVKIRFKELANGNKSIYLAWWDGEAINKKKGSKNYGKMGLWQYEFLKLHIVPGTSPEAQTQNENTLRKAVQIKSQRIDEMQNAAHGLTNYAARSKTNLVEYIHVLAEKKRNKAGGGKRTTAETYIALAKQITAYNGTKTTFKQVNKQFCLGFIEYLRTVKNRNNGEYLHENTQVGYVRNLGHVLKRAFKDGIIPFDPMAKIEDDEKPKKRNTEICYLTKDEIKRLENAVFPVSAVVKQAFMFGCYTGLRISDIRGLTWGKIQTDYAGKDCIVYTQKKTGKTENLPLPSKAKKYFPERNKANDNDPIFKIPDGSYCNKMLKFWAASAGINKHLTFHVSRHTYATLLLSLGEAIETVSKNLGHSEIRVTQNYAKVIYTSQRAAVDRLNDLID